MSYRSNPKFYCDRCNGNGGWIDFHETMEVFFTCPECTGTGMFKTITNKYGESRIKTGAIKEDNRNVSTDIVRDTYTAS